MKQKYAVMRDDEQKTLIVREYAELDKEMMSLLCEETYPLADIALAVPKGAQAVIDTLRTNNMYPPTTFAQAIAEAVIGMFSEEGGSSAELFFDDRELFDRDAELHLADTEEDADSETEEDVEVDDLLDDSIDDDFEDDKVLKDLKSSIQVADDDTNDLEDVS